MHEKNKSSDRGCGVQSDFSAVVRGSELHALDAEWPQNGCGEDRKPGGHEESEDVLVIVVDGGNARDEGEYAQGNSEGIEEINIANEVAIANRCG